MYIWPTAHRNIYLKSVLVITVAVEYVFGTTSDAPQYSPFFSGFSGGFNDLPRRPAGIGSESR